MVSQKTRGLDSRFAEIQPVLAKGSLTNLLLSSNPLLWKDAAFAV